MVRQGFLNLSDAEKDKVFQVALDEFAQFDFTSASLNRIIQHAGIAKGSMYHYFQNKEDLYLYVLDQAMQDKAAFLTRSLQTLDKPLTSCGFFAKIRSMVHASAAFATAYPRYNQMNLLLHGMPDGPFKQRIWQRFNQGFDEFVQDMVAEAVHKKEVRADLDRTLMVRILRVFLLRFGELLPELGQPHGLSTTDQILDDLINFLANGLKEANNGSFS